MMYISSLLIGLISVNYQYFVIGGFGKIQDYYYNKAINFNVALLDYRLGTGNIRQPTKSYDSARNIYIYIYIYKPPKLKRVLDVILNFIH